MFLLIKKKPSWSQARAAARITEENNKPYTAREIINHKFLVVLDESKKVVGMIITKDDLTPDYFAINETILKAIKKKVP